MSYPLKRALMSTDFGPYLSHTQLRVFVLPLLRALSESLCTRVLIRAYKPESTPTFNQIRHRAKYTAGQTTTAVKKLHAGRVLEDNELTMRRSVPLMLTQGFVGMFEPIFFGGPHADYNAILDAMEEILDYPMPDSLQELGRSTYQKFEQELSVTEGWQKRVRRAEEILGMKFSPVAYKSKLQTIAQPPVFDIILCCNEKRSASKATLSEKTGVDEASLEPLLKRLIHQGILLQTDASYSICFDYLPALVSLLPEMFHLAVASIQDLLQQAVGIEHSLRKEEL